MMLILTDNDILSKGTNKIVYRYPGDNTRCIKLSLWDDTDVQYELKYRKICKDIVKNSSLLTKYYGTIDTNLGIGYIFELVRDYDGNVSETLKDFIFREKDVPRVFSVLKLLKKKLFAEKIITYKLFPDNVMIQRITAQEVRIRIIDGIGMHVFLPLPYYIEPLARQRRKRIWKRFMNYLCENYGLPDEIHDTDKVGR